MIGRIAKQQGRQPGEKPKWPGPIAGPGNPWPQKREPQAPPTWPQPQQQPQQQRTQPTRTQPAPPPQRTEGYGSLGTARTEGVSSMVTGSFADERARFHGEIEQFRRGRHQSSLHHPKQEEPELAPVEISPLAQVLLSKEGLAQAVLVSEVLGKPRALRPYGKR